MYSMKLIINIFLILFFTGCTGSHFFNVNQRAVSEYLVTCPHHIFYCYRKSDLICYRGYRLIKITNFKENKNMNIKCN